MRGPERWWHRFTGGRPMSCLAWCFQDVVMRGDVFLWADAYGRFWLAHGRWSRFRVASESPEIWLDARPTWSLFHESRRDAPRR